MGWYCLMLSCLLPGTNTVMGAGTSLALVTMITIMIFTGYLDLETRKLIFKVHWFESVTMSVKWLLLFLKSEVFKILRYFLVLAISCSAGQISIFQNQKKKIVSIFVLQFRALLGRSCSTYYMCVPSGLFLFVRESEKQISFYSFYVLSLSCSLKRNG